MASIAEPTTAHPNEMSANAYFMPRAMSTYLFIFMVVLAAILNLTSRGHQRSRPFCLRWILKTHCPYLTACKISKTCHQVHDCFEFRPRYRHSQILLNIYTGSENLPDLIGRVS